MMDAILNILNTSPFIGGIAMFIMNIGGKYMVHEIPETTDYLFMKYKFFRYLVVFSIAFISTRNIKMSILLTFLFILIFRFLIETNSKFCVINKNKIPKQNQINKQNNQQQIDSNMIEYHRAIEIIKNFNRR